MSSPFPTRSALHQASATSKPARGRGVLRQTVQVVGELLITIGVVLLLYVFWQLYWTTFEVQGGMTERIEQFQAETDAPQEVTDLRETGDPPEVGPVIHDQVFGVLHVPKWGMEIPIAQGTTPDVLNNGDAGHYPDTQMPGEIGNFAIAGHRRTYGNNFRRVDIMEPGDPIVVETAQAYLVYRVTGHRIVLPSDTEVILPVPDEPGAVPTTRIMTMTTCHPEFGNSHRYILWSEMEYWVPKEDGRPDVLG